MNGAANGSDLASHGTQFLQQLVVAPAPGDRADFPVRIGASI